MDNKDRITPSLEDYLEAIYFLSIKNGSVRVTDVATALLISKPSVNKAIKSLKNKGYVEQEYYGLLNLTEKGTEIAKGVAKCHIILKDFLMYVLKIDEKTAEKEACSIEHIVSIDTVNKIEAFLLNYKENNIDTD